MVFDLIDGIAPNPNVNFVSGGPGARERRDGSYLEKPVREKWRLKQSVAAMSTSPAAASALTRIERY